VECGSEAATERLARAAAGVMAPSQMVALVGPLGSGKTAWVRHLAAALGAPGVASPSFAVIHVYEGGRVPIVHADLYRVSDLEELTATGFFDLLGGDHLVVVEWAERVPEVVDRAEWTLGFEDLGADRRAIQVRAPSERALEALRSRFDAGPAGRPS
jgi:tRNA threonylcarbamoyladenosine biosynthesis protein TsaE